MKESISNESSPEVEGEAAAEAPPAGPTFAELGLGSGVLTALTEMGFSRPMKVQAATIPLVQAGRDLMVQSRTGSGKTAAFGIPVVDKLVRAEDKFVQAIILLPTRELALQVASELARIAAHSGITVVPVYGGAPMGRQIEQLKAGGQIVCGTPGRVLDHMRRGTLVLDQVRCAILDECDEMLSMGFQEDIEAILERTPSSRQTLLFSATVPEGIQRLSRRFLRDPENLKLSADFVGVQEIRHVYYTIPGGQRENELLRVLAFENPGRAIVFCNTREETGRVAEFLRRQGFDAEAISSDLAQADRERVMGRMRKGEIRFLVATDVAARGIDLEALSHVINYTFPESPEVYIHRTGRTGRAGRHGTAISLIGPTEVGAFYYVKLLYKIKPEERSLPSEAEIRSKREGERIESLRARFAAEPGVAWRSLARRLMSAIDGERLVAALLAEAVTGASEAPAVAAVEPRATEEPAREPRTDSGTRGPGTRDRLRDRERERGGDRPRYGARDEGRGRPGDRDRGRDRGSRDRDRDRNGRSSEGERFRSNGTTSLPPAPPAPVEEPAAAIAAHPAVTERSAIAERPAPAERPAITERPARPAARPSFGAEAPAEADRDRARRPREERDRGGYGGAPRDARRTREPGRSERPAGDRPPGGGGDEFWSVWSDPPAEASAPVATENLRETRLALDPTDPGLARLFLNLGRKDDASPEEVAALLQDVGVAIAPGDIDVMNTHSYVNVPASDADRICAGLSGRDRNGRALLCERARPRRR